MLLLDSSCVVFHLYVSIGSDVRGLKRGDHRNLELMTFSVEFYKLYEAPLGSVSRGHYVRGCMHS